MTIWDDEWTMVAAREETRLPPRPVENVRVTATTAATAEWLEFIHSGWTVAEATRRLEEAIIICVRTTEGRLTGTCVLRPRRDRWWVLESLRADSGYGGVTIRAAVRWLWEQTDGRFRLAFLWELRLHEAAAALMRGWWRAWRRTEWGWSWRTPESCGWCPAAGADESRPWLRKKQRQSTSILVTSDSGAAVVCDSGDAFGTGWVLSWSGQPDWSAIATKMNWKHLWCHFAIRPDASWLWSGEVVFIGALNSIEPPPADIFISAEL